MARTKVDPTIVRPTCPDHPGSRIRLDGFRHCPWSDAHRRPRYRCVTEPGTRGHSFSLPVAVRQPTERHPDAGATCPTCEHVYGRHEGVRTGRDFVFGHAEIARLLARVGEGMSLRAASRDLREHLLRVAEGEASRAANLAVNSTRALEGAIGEWLVPLRRRAGRWQNARQLDLVLGLMTLRARGAAREARYAAIIRREFAVRGNRSHTPAENSLPVETYRGRVRQMSWWRTFHDRAEPSLPALVRAATRHWRARAQADHLVRVKERLAERYVAELDIRTVLGLPTPPSGRPKRATRRTAASVRGRTLADYPDLVLEWAWDINADLDPARLAAGSHQRVAWRCLLDAAHVWETRVADRTYHDSACPYHMGVRVHPAESLAAYYPWLASEWHPTANDLRPDQVTRASARDVVWRCEAGHTWTAAVYQRTLSGTSCPDCYRLEAAARSRTGTARARRKRDAAELAKVIALPPRAAGSEAG